MMVIFLVEDKEILDGLHSDGIYSKDDLIFGLLLEVFIRQVGYNLNDPKEFEEQMKRCYKLLK